MTMKMNKNKYKTIYSDIIPVYRESEDYCRMTLDMLKYAIADLDKPEIRSAFSNLTKCFDDLTKTVKEISIRFREVSELADSCLDDGLRKEKKNEG